MSQRNKQTPSNWDAYERGRASSFGSLESVPEDAPQDVTSSSIPAAQQYLPDYEYGGSEGGSRRRSSFSKRFDSIRQIGGPNSIDNFARSLQRAAGFREITPIRRNSVTLSEPDQEAGSAPSSAEQSTSIPNRSLLRQQLRDYHLQGPSESAVHDDQTAETNEPTEESALLPVESRQTFKSTAGSLRPGVFAPQ